MHGGSNIDVVKTIHSIRFLTSEWLSCNSKEVSTSKAGKKSVCWVKPEGRFLKMKCDASIVLPDFCTGLGVVVRNAEGMLVDGVSKITDSNSVLAAEAKALK